MTRVLLLGAAGSAGINFASAVERYGVELIGADVDARMLPLSACPTNVAIGPVDDSDRLEQVQAIVDRYGIDVIHAQPDAEVEWLSEHRHDVGARTLLPPRDAIDLCADKLGVAQVIGRDLAPRSYNASIGALDSGLGGSAWMRLRKGAGSMGALPVHSNAMMEAWVEHWWTTRGVYATAWMLAEILPGRDLSWTDVYADGELQASACKERIVPMGASHPANVSSTASVQTIVVRPDVNERCEQAVALIDPEPAGVYMVDLREDAAGVPKITEVNAGRFGTTSLFWRWAGRNANLVETYLDCAVGVRWSEPLRDCCTPGATWLRATDALPRVAA